jgi:hypothetical protein
LPSTTAGTTDIGVSFDEPVDAVSAAVAANYSIAPGTITSVTYNAKSQGVLLKVTGLAAGASATVTVKNVADLKGNKITTATVPVTVSSKMKWGVVGAGELGKGAWVVPVSDNGFDLYSDGIAEWATYDEATFVYEEVTGDFDKMLRVEYQDNSSQWARAGLIVREVLNFGVDRTTQTDSQKAGRYQKCHVNPVGPTLTGPGTAGNGAWETNRRLQEGGATSAAGGGGNPVPYPNAWCRIKRTGSTFEMFRSSDAVNWVSLGTTTFDPPMAAKLYVGPEFSPENGNIPQESDRAIWMTKIRDYGNYPPVIAPTAPTLTRDYSIGLNFGADEPTTNKLGTLKATDKAGVAGIAQGNWNNLSAQNGTNVTAIVADKAGVAEATSVSVSWTCNNLWSSTGRGEENNALTGADKALMTGYLDTGSATTTRVTINGIPASLADKGYDLYVYAMGGVGGRGGSYRIVDAATKVVLRDYIRAQSPTNATSFVEVPTNLGAPDGSGNRTSALVFGLGNYLVFRGLTSPAITLEATTAAAGGGIGFGSTPRAPINAIQLVAPTTAKEADDVTSPLDLIVTSNTDARSPAAEQVRNAIDNNLLTKYLNFGNDTDTAAPFVGPVGFTLTSKTGVSVVTGIAMTSANDAPERDPASYKLEGSNDGATFTVISEGAVPKFSARFVRQVIPFANTAAYSVYRLSIPNVLNNATANSMQVAEVELLGTITAPFPRITGMAKNADGSITVTWTGGGTLQAAPAVTGPWQDVAGATSPYNFKPSTATLFGRIKK